MDSQYTRSKINQSVRSKHTKGSKERYLLGQTLKTQHANFRGNPLYQATERHLTVKR